MIKQIKGIERVEGHSTSTESMFLASELTTLSSQPGAIGRALIRFRHTNGLIYDAAVGRNSSGPMIDPLNLVAIPCPPLCGGEGQWVPYTTL